MKLLPALLLFSNCINSLVFAFTPSLLHHHHVSSTTKTNTKTLFMAAFESTDEIELDVEERFGKCIDSLSKNLLSIRTGRANPSILDLVMVEYYGCPTKLNQMASISVPNSQQLSVEPFDKSTLGDVERAIIEANLGLNPNNDGSVIRINIPAITEERRKELLKSCKAMGEDGKVAIRNVRRDGVDAVKKMEKAGDISEDESKGVQDSIQKITDKYVKEVDTIISKKEKEVMTV
jgi:ribosome recycling factor